MKATGRRLLLCFTEINKTKTLFILENSKYIILVYSKHINFDVGVQNKGFIKKTKQLDILHNRTQD